MARCVDAQTQTAGLFFPSSTELQKRSQQKEAELSRQGQMSDRKPLLTSISPGRGYMQDYVEHITMQCLIDVVEGRQEFWAPQNYLLALDNVLGLYVLHVRHLF